MLLTLSRGVIGSGSGNLDQRRGSGGIVDRNGVGVPVDVDGKVVPSAGERGGEQGGLWADGRGSRHDAESLGLRGGPGGAERGAGLESPDVSRVVLELDKGGLVFVSVV